MAEIILPFNSWSRKKLALHLKTATTRTYKAGAWGDHFHVGMVAFLLEATMKTTLQVVARDFYHEEGAATPEEFIEVWKDLHPYNGWQPEKIVWIHFFSELETVNRRFKPHQP